MCDGLQEFRRVHKKEPLKDARAVARLRIAVERAKRTLSTAMEAPVQVHCLVGDLDCCTTLTRARFEDLAREHFSQWVAEAAACMRDAHITPDQVRSANACACMRTQQAAPVGAAPHTPV
jgi:heat shock 70kDa protein 1/2/6/8